MITPVVLLYSNLPLGVIASGATFETRISVNDIPPVAALTQLAPSYVKTCPFS